MSCARTKKYSSVLWMASSNTNEICLFNNIPLNYWLSKISQHILVIRPLCSWCIGTVTRLTSETTDEAFQSSARGWLYKWDTCQFILLRFFAVLNTTVACSDPQCFFVAFQNTVTKPILPAWEGKRR